MYISKLKIKNFKCYREVNISFDPDFNLIIGENNSGKSTIFDALRLWQLAFQKFLKDRTNNQSSSFYASQFFSFTIEDIAFLRILSFDSLLFNSSKKDFEITLFVSDGNIEVELPIIFTKTTKGQILNFQFCKLPNERPNKSNEISHLFGIPKGSDLKDLFLFTYINPIFSLPNNEPLYSKGYILNKLRESKANEIIRNLLFTISPEKKKKKKDPKSDKLIEIESLLKTILNIDDISFSKRLEDEDSYINIYSKNNITNTEVEINQLGSGTINVLNILAVLAYGDYEKFKLNLLLLDEPDSHLHFNHQSRLYKYLKQVSEDSNKQIFIITHNSSLISQFDKVLFLDKNKRDINNILLNEYLNEYLIKINEEHYKVIKELNDEKKERESSEEKLKSITKPILYCEGSTDVVILKAAFESLYGISTFFEDNIDIEDGNSESGVAQFIKSNSKKEICIIGLLDNDRAGQKQVNVIEKNISKPYEIKRISDIHYQKYNGKEELKTHLLLLPIPEFRKEQATFFERNLHIEYMFSNEALKNKLKVEMIKEKGETFEKIKLGGDGKINQEEKDKVTKNINSLNSEDFIHFRPLFEKIAGIVGYTLPENA